MSKALQKNVGGRPPVKIDDKKLKKLMELRPSLPDTAAFFDCSVRTIQRYIRDNYDLEFLEFQDRYMVHTRIKLIEKALDKALNGIGDNTMLIFCLKNLCAWSDKRPGEDDKVVEYRGEIGIAKVDLVERVRQIKGDVEKLEEPKEA